MLSPKNRVLKSYKYCFYGREFENNPNLDEAVKKFLDPHGMEFHPDVSPGEWLWPGLIRAMSRSAFCIFETVTGNRNAHIELGYALARRLHVALLIEKGSEENRDIVKNLPSNLAGLVQVRYEREDEVAGKLKKSVPEEWWSVESRLGPRLRQASALDKAYFWWLLQVHPDDTVEFDDLVDKAQQYVPGSSRTKLASFVRQFDEALIIEGLTPPEDWPCGSTVWKIDVRQAVIHQKIRVDPDYREWVAKTLELELHRPYGA
jgi:hypothetical protein